MERIGARRIVEASLPIILSARARACTGDIEGDIDPRGVGSAWARDGRVLVKAAEAARCVSGGIASQAARFACRVIEAWLIRPRADRPCL